MPLSCDSYERSILKLPKLVPSHNLSEKQGPSTNRRSFRTCLGSGNSRHAADTTVHVLSCKISCVSLLFEHSENHIVTLIQWGFLTVGVPVVCIEIFLWNLKTPSSITMSLTPTFLMYSFFRFLGTHFCNL